MSTLSVIRFTRRTGGRIVTTAAVTTSAALVVVNRTSSFTPSLYVVATPKAGNRRSLPFYRSCITHCGTDKSVLHLRHRSFRTTATVSSDAADTDAAETTATAAATERAESFVTNSPTSSSSSLSPLLTTWYSLTKHIPIQQILPIGLGNPTELPNHNAFFGDKRLNMHISLLLRTQSDDTTATISNNNNTSPSLPPVGTVTNIQSIAMSNQLLASCIAQILPFHMTTIEYGNIYTALIQNNSQIHDAGTMIEATVDYVANLPLSSMHSTNNSSLATSTGDGNSTDTTNENNNDTHISNNSHNDVKVVPIATSELVDTALTELAQFLIEKAKTYQLHPSSDDTKNDETDGSSNKSPALTTTDLHNPKGELLNHGGRMTCKRLEGYPDHAPQFTATAHIDDLTSTVYHGRNKRETEQSAAAMLWRYYSKSVLPKKENVPVVSDDLDDIENPKGRILSIGGKVTSDKLPGHPEHLPRFRAVCSKPFFILQQRQAGDDDDDSDEEDIDDENGESSKKMKMKYMIEATAEGRTRYEAERIASVIVWRHVMSMKTIPIPSDNVAKLVPFVTEDIEVKEKAVSNDNTTKDGWFGDMDENDPMFDNTDPRVPEPVEPKLSAKQRRKLRTLKNATVRHISQFDIRDTQDNFLHFQLTDHERPHINLRPGGETVIESWYRGALNPLAAFHRALIAPHVFPNHIGTVNAFTRHNILPDSTLNPNPAHDEELGETEDTFVDHRKIYNESGGNVGPTETQESLSDTVLTPPLVTESDTNATATTISSSSSSSSAITTLSSSLLSSDSTVVVSPFDDPNIEVAVRRDKKYKRTFTVLAFVVPNLQHPILADMGMADYNTNELMTKCFVEHGYNVRETRNAIGVKINQYIIDVLLKDFEDLDEIIERKRMEKERQRNLRDGLSRQERKNMFFKF